MVIRVIAARRCVVVAAAKGGGLSERIQSRRRWMVCRRIKLQIRWRQQGTHAGAERVATMAAAAAACREDRAVGRACRTLEWRLGRKWMDGRMGRVDGWIGIWVQDKCGYDGIRQPEVLDGSGNGWAKKGRAID